MSGKADREKKEQKKIPFNIGTVIFGAVFIYLIITLVMYLSADHISSYVVTAGTLSGNDTCDAIALRTETVVDSGTSGYVNRLCEAGTKVSRGDSVCSIGEEKNSVVRDDPGPESMSRIKSLLSSFSRAYDSSDFSEVYTLKYSLNAAAYGETVSDGSGSAVSAPVDGVVSYVRDGYESMQPTDLSEKDFEAAAYSATQLGTEDKVSKGDSVFRIASDDTWHLVFPVSDRQYSKLASLATIKIRFDKDGQTETGDLNLFDNDNAHYADVTLYSGMVRYCSDRHLEIELVTNTLSGLKIPISAIVNKEFYLIPASFLTTGGDNNESGFLRQTSSDGKNSGAEFVAADIYEDTTVSDGSEVVYVDESVFNEGDIILKPDSSETFEIGDTGTLEGVYCTNRGYAQFRKVDILDQNDEFCIVDEGTSYGISQYDYIVRDASTVNESQILG